MSISFASALGIHDKALSFRAQRAEVLANNMANADTPGFKARDLDFASALAEQSSKAQGGEFQLKRNNSRHIEADGFPVGDSSQLYRTPAAPSLDQNTVDLQLEQASYAENSVQFQASFALLNIKFKGLIGAIRGE